MRWFSRIFLAYILVVTGVGLSRADPVAPSSATPPPAPPAQRDDQAADQAADPRLLFEEGERHLARGDKGAARAAFEAGLKKEELARYLNYGSSLREALLLERLGEWDAAAAIYQKERLRDPLYAALTLRMASRHPDRDELLAEITSHVRELARRANTGAKDATIYVTSKGEPRFLEHLEPTEVLSTLAAAARAQEPAIFRYCQIDVLDLSKVDPALLPPRIQFSQCVLGRVLIPDQQLGQLVVSGFVLDRFDVGKTWEGAVNKSKARPGSRFVDLTTRETVFLGEANFQDITVTGRKASFPLTVFEGGADFRGARLQTAVDFRFSVFGEGAHFRGARFSGTAYLGSARFRRLTSFTGLHAEQDIYFDSARFEDEARFDGCDWQRRATFENATFARKVGFTSTRVLGRLNLSRAVFSGPLDMEEVSFGGLDAFGARFEGDTRFADARFAGKVRFSLDDATRRASAESLDALLPLYRDYQGDDDADVPLASGTSYGVTRVDDLTAQILEGLSFANAVFEGFCIFEGVTFGRQGSTARADFFNTQFQGETHFERTVWHVPADFTTIRATELAMNEATFHHTLLLDDANIPGRVTLTDAAFEPQATLSFYGAQIATFQIDREQIEGPEGHRLWYGRCAEDDRSNDAGRVDRLRVDDAAIRATCAERVMDEYVTLKQSFGDRGMTADEDWAWWWLKHVETWHQLRDGGLAGVAAFPVRTLLFEAAFGWGVRLENLLATALFLSLLFSVLYKKWCADTVMSYDGQSMRLGDISWSGVFYISLQSLGAFNTGWDFEDSDHRFRYLNTLHTYTGVILMTFFVGAYTRMILA